MVTVDFFRKRVLDAAVTQLNVCVCVTPLDASAKVTVLLFERPPMVCFAIGIHSVESAGYHGKKREVLANDGRAIEMSNFCAQCAFTIVL